MTISKVTNGVKMIGVLPSQGADPIPVGKIPDGGTQVAKSGGIGGSTRIIHTVTGGTTFYLTHYTLESNSSVIDTTARLFVRNVGDSLLYDIMHHYFDAVGQLVNTGQFQPPLELAAGFDVCIVTDNVDCETRGFIHGYEV